MTHLSRMTCEEAFRRLDAFLDRELAPEEMELVRAHLEVCTGCAREFKYEASVLEEIRAKLRQLDVPHDFRSRILAALDSERGNGDRRAHGDGAG